MLERGTGGFAVILENQDVLETAVLLEVENTVAEGPEHVFDALGRQRAQAGVVVRGLDNDLVRSDAVHLVEHALGLAVQIALDAEGRELVGNHAHRPARAVALWRRSSIGIGTIGLNLRGSLILVTVTKGTKTTLEFDSLPHEIRGTFGAVGRNNDPPSYNRIFSKLRQALNPFSRVENKPLFYATEKLFWNNSNCGGLDC